MYALKSKWLCVGTRHRHQATRALIEQGKPRLWRSLEELRDRAKDVEEKVASLVSRAQAEMEEVRHTTVQKISINLVELQKTEDGSKHYFF